MKNMDCIASSSITFGQTTIQGFVSLDFNERTLIFSTELDNYELIKEARGVDCFDIQFHRVIFGSLSERGPIANQMRFWGGVTNEMRTMHVTSVASNRIEIVIHFHEWLEVESGPISDSFSECVVRFPDMNTLMGANVYQPDRERKISVCDFQLGIRMGVVRGSSGSLTLETKTVKSDPCAWFEFANPRSLTKIRQEIGGFRLYSAILLGKWPDGFQATLSSENSEFRWFSGDKITLDDALDYMPFTLFDVIDQYIPFREKILSASTLAQNLFEIFQTSPLYAHFKQSIDLGELLVKTFDSDVLPFLKNEDGRDSVKARMIYILEEVEGLVDLSDAHFGSVRNKITHEPNAEVEMTPHDWFAVAPMMRAYILKRIGIPEDIIRWVVERRPIIR